MLETKKKYKPKLKPYHIILLAVALCPFLILNSNSVNKKREEEAQLKEDHKFLEKLYLRKLDFKSDVEAICEKGSDDLKEYYKTGDPEIIKIDDKEIKSEDNPEYINSLINLVASQGEGSIEEDAKEYAMHLGSVIAFLALAILSLPIWFIYCICCCANCCCCCCCKKQICKIPFFIVAAAFYVLVVVISIYGLSQSNSIFVGLADTECSLLKFIGEVLDGETKETKPKWAGISGIKGLFQNTKEQIQALDHDDTGTLSSARRDASDAKNNFENALQYYSQRLNPNSNYKKTIGDDYCLDIIVNFGQFNKDNPPTESDGSLVSGWYEEFKIVSSNSEQQMQTAYENFDQLTSSQDAAVGALGKGIDEIGNIEGSFNDIKDQISGPIVEYSDKIDEYGKLAFKIIFTVFMVVDIAIAAFMTLLLFCSFQCCKSCCCCRCLFKSLLHILWNILAFLTFLVLLLGSIFALVGKVGQDLISVVSFIVSDKNLGEDEPILVAQVKDYLSKCINGNGDIGNDLFGNDLNEINNVNSLRSASNAIDNLITELGNVQTNTIACNLYEGEFNKRANYNIDNFQLINLSPGGSNLNFRTYLNNLNSHIPGNKDHEWSISCSGSASFLCDSYGSAPDSGHLCINPNTCVSSDISNWYTSPSSDNVNVIKAFINSIQTARASSSSDTTTVDGTTVQVSDNIYTILGDLKSKYSDFIGTYKTSLEGFKDIINDIAAILNEFAGVGNNSGIFSIINCKFIGRNVKIILKNLDKSVGQSFYTVGICMVISGISMLLSIAFTILLNSIINETSANKN